MSSLPFLTFPRDFVHFVRFRRDFWVKMALSDSFKTLEPTFKPTPEIGLTVFQKKCPKNYAFFDKDSMICFFFYSLFLKNEIRNNFIFF